jgi:predicted AlkP superfamily phosphohydrolase/phosphomutase
LALLYAGGWGVDMTKVLVVGLDGATFDVIRPLAADGRLPTLAYLMKEGASGSLRSNIPPITPSAWTSIFTGKNPGKHGIYDFERIDPQTYQLQTVRASQHSEKTLWQLLGEANKRSIVLDVPFTYPPQPLNGFMLSGYGTPRTPGSIFTYPQNLEDSLPAALRSEVRVALPSHRFDRSQQFIDEWQEIMAGRRKFLNYFIEQEAWDFFMVVFSITDNMAHVFWTYVDPTHPNYYREEGEVFREAFYHGYELCDQLLGELIEKAGPDTTTLVLSDHGFGSVRPRQYIFQRLLEGGYLKLQSLAGTLSLKSQLMKTAVTSYNRFPFLREWVKGLRPDRLVSLKRSLYNSGIMPSEKNLDLRESRIIPSSFGLSLWVNEQGRYSAGNVAPGQKAELLAELSQYLLADRDKVTGEPIVANTYEGERLYHGPFIAHRPDLVVEYANFFKPEAAPTLSNPYLEGGHTLEGIFLAYGTPIQRAAIQGAGLIDLTPTILHLLEQPIPPDMDGRVLTTAMTDGYLAAHPIQWSETPARLTSPLMAQSYTAEEEKEVNEQLRQLGYIE